MGDESVAWAAGGGEALTQSLVTHWRGGGGARGLSPGGQAAPTLQHYSALDTWSHYTSQPPGVMFLEGASEGHPEGPGLGHKNSQS